MQLTAPAARRTGVRDADGMAVASFILGLLGLLVLNVFLGPIAVVWPRSPSGAVRPAPAAPTSAWPWASPTS